MQDGNLNAGKLTDFGSSLLNKLPAITRLRSKRDAKILNRKYIE